MAELTTDEMSQIMVDVMNEREPTIRGVEADEFRRALQPDVDLAKKNGWALIIEPEWEVGPQGGNVTSNNCGVGSKGFEPGNTCAKKGASAVDELLIDYVSQIAELRQGNARGLKYRGVEPIVKEYGRLFTAPVSVEKNTALMKQHGVTPGAMKECFSNAGRCVLGGNSDLTYVEGYAQAIIPIHHAWLVTKDGQVIDPTWSTERIKPGESYFGVPLSSEYVTQLAINTERWTVFDPQVNPDVFKTGLPESAVVKDITANNCGVGSKGFEPGNTCAKGGGDGPSEKAQRAKTHAVRVDVEIQRYSEEFNEPHFAEQVGGESLTNNEPVDVRVEVDGKLHGIELKTMTVGKNNKLTMKKEAMERKAAWEKKNKGRVHTVVYDDTKVFNANGSGKHDLSQRKIYYRRGYGSFRVNGMMEVSSEKELRGLLSLRINQLPPSAGGTKKGK
jgi:hypothetical protein